MLSFCEKKILELVHLSIISNNSCVCPDESMAMSKAIFVSILLKHCDSDCSESAQIDQ